MRINELRRLDPIAAIDLDAVVEHADLDALFEAIVAEDPSRRVPDAGEPTVGQGSETAVSGEHWRVVLGARPERVRRRRRVVVGVLGIGVAAAIGLPIALGGVSPLIGPFTTPWRSARALAAGAHFTTPRGQRGTWQLVGDIVRTGWQLNTAGPTPGYLTCPTATACYVTGDGAPTDTGPANFDTLYFSSDAGATWSALPLPSGLSFTSQLSCADAMTCAAGGSFNGQPVFASTVDAGHQWTVTPLSTPNELVSLRCSSATTCNGVTEPGAVANAIATGNGPAFTQADDAFVHTSDGGASWTAHSFAVNDIVASMTCSTASSCIVLGFPISALPHPGVSGFARSTNDSGQTWTSGTLPRDFGFLGFLSGISCSDSTHCMALGLTSEPNPDRCVGPNQNNPQGSNWCSSGAAATVSSVATTADGGLSWQSRPLPADVPLPSLSDLSCPSSNECWVSGEEAVPQGNNGGSSVLLHTTDFGMTWSKTTFVVPKGAPEDLGHDSYMAIGTISCPGVAVCVALGVSDQGSSFTAVYSYASGATP